MPLDLNQHGIIVEAETQGCTIEVYLNGIPVGLCGVGTGRKLTRPVHEYLVDGSNELAVLINPGDTPSLVESHSRKSRAAAGAQPPPSPLLDSFLGVEDEPSEAEKELFADLHEAAEETSPRARAEEGDQPPAPFAGFTNLEFGGRPSAAATTDGDELDEAYLGLPYDAAAAFAASLSLYQVGAMALDGTGHPLIQIGWRAADEGRLLSRARVPFPRWIRRETDLGEMFGPLHWQEAPVLALDAETVEAALAFVLEMRDAVEAGNAGPILEASAIRFKEVARSYGISPDERAKMLRQMLTSQCDRPDWLFVTPEEEELDFRLVADGRMIECVGPDWNPLIKGMEGEKGRFLLPMMIGRRDDDWLIMR